MSNLKDIKEFGCPYPKIQCKSCKWNYADICNFDFDSYHQGRADEKRENEQDAYHRGYLDGQAKCSFDNERKIRADERERIVRELEELHERYLNRYGIVGNYSLSAIRDAIEIARGEENEKI